MMQMMLMSLMITTNFIFIQLNHPLAMGLLLLLQTTLITISSGILVKTFWFSYMLFLIFMGGLLVLFIYVTSLASNEMFSLSMKMMFYSIMMLMTMFLISLLFMNMNLSFINNNEMISLTFLNKMIKENSLMLIKLYNYPNNMISLMLMNYLLITLIAIVKITKFFKGPLRMMN